MTGALAVGVVHLRCVLSRGRESDDEIRGMMYITAVYSMCVGAMTRGVVVCRCSGRFVGASRIETGVGSDVSSTDGDCILLVQDV